MPKPDQPSCIQCNAWLERYYTDVPLLQSKIKSLEEQVTVLSKENDRLQANEKKQKTTGSIVFRNVEASNGLCQFKIIMIEAFSYCSGMNFNINFVL
jgi:hypothetical protein